MTAPPQAPRSSSADRVPVFFYGSFMDPAILRKYGVAVAVGTGVLAEAPGWRLAFAPMANLLPLGNQEQRRKSAPVAVAHGIIYDVDPESARVAYEEPMVKDYEPLLIQVRTARGESQEVLTYVIPADQCKEAPPQKDYVDRWSLAAYKVKLPETYVAQVVQGARQPVAFERTKTETD